LTIGCAHFAPVCAVRLCRPCAQVAALHACCNFINALLCLLDAFCVHRLRCLSPQVAALHACCNFINALDDAREREAFQPMLVPMLAALGRCLTAGDESSAQVGGGASCLNSAVSMSMLWCQMS
jgi:hypothetical protein